MTETELEPIPTTKQTNAASWDTAFAALKAKFPKAKDTIVFCIQALQNNPEVDIEDLKAQAVVHNLRVTAASVNAAKRLMAPPEVDSDKDSEPAVPKAAPVTRRTRGPRAAETPLDVEDLIRGTVAKLQAQGNAEAEKLREAIRRAVATLQAAVDS